LSPSVPSSSLQILPVRPIHVCPVNRM
jgi:hypothetical protein